MQKHTLNKQLIDLCKKYKVEVLGDSMYLSLCSKVKRWSKQDQIKFVNAYCSYHNSNTNDYARGVIETYNLCISLKDLYEKRGLL
jgi:hypothetical protein